jgi:hypothetical protein
MLRTLVLAITLAQTSSWIQAVPRSGGSLLSRNWLPQAAPSTTRLASTAASESYAPVSASQDAPASKEPFDYWRAW